MARHLGMMAVLTVLLVLFAGVAARRERLPQIAHAGGLYQVSARLAELPLEAIEVQKPRARRARPVFAVAPHPAPSPEGRVEEPVAIVEEPEPTPAPASSTVVFFVTEPPPREPLVPRAYLLPKPAPIAGKVPRRPVNEPGGLTILSAKASAPRPGRPTIVSRGSSYAPGGAPGSSRPRPLR